MPRRTSIRREKVEIIEAAILKAIESYGNLTEPYGDYVRKQAIKFWLELDRHRIFIIENIGQ